MDSVWNAAARTGAAPARSTIAVMPRSLHRAVARLCVLALPVLGAAASVHAQKGQEPKLALDLLDNGSGAEPNGSQGDDPRASLVPWWTSSGAPRGAATNPPALVVLPGEALSQPIAAYAPYA